MNKNYSMKDWFIMPSGISEHSISNGSVIEVSGAPTIDAETRIRLNQKELNKEFEAKAEHILNAYAKVIQLYDASQENQAETALLHAVFKDVFEKTNCNDILECVKKGFYNNDWKQAYLNPIKCMVDAPLQYQLQYRRNKWSQIQKSYKETHDTSNKFLVGCFKVAVSKPVIVIGAVASSVSLGLGIGLICGLWILLGAVAGVIYMNTQKYIQVLEKACETQNQHCNILCDVLKPWQEALIDLETKLAEAEWNGLIKRRVLVNPYLVSSRHLLEAAPPL